MRRALTPAAARRPRYPTLRVAWRILAATMPLAPAAAHADATVPGEHRPAPPERPAYDGVPPVIVTGGAPPVVAPPTPPPPPKKPPKPAPAPRPAPPRLGGKVKAPSLPGGER